MKILIADDDPVSRLKLNAILEKNGYEVVVTCDGEEAWEMLNRPDAPNLAIIDWIMPGMDGVDLCRKLRNSGTRPYTYVILLTAKDSREDIIEGMASGADDYIIKPFDPQELNVRLRAGKRIVSLQADLLEAREAYRVRAITDPLTGIYNRQEILDVLKKELDRWIRTGESLSLIMIDIDHFKNVNDEYGHQAGDAILREIAQAITSNLRSYDSAGRYGGEEFIVIVPESSGSDGYHVAERIRSSIEGRFFSASEKNLRITVSIGVGSTDQNGPASADELIRLVDSALYRAKNNGRNRTEQAEIHS